MKLLHKGRAGFSAEQRAALVGSYRSSGLTQREFARRHQIKFTTLRNWLYGRRSKARRVDPPLALQAIPLAQLLRPEGWAAEVALRNGAVVRLKGDADPQWVSAIVERLGGLC